MERVGVARLGRSGGESGRIGHVVNFGGEEILQGLFENGRRGQRGREAARASRVLFEIIVIELVCCVYDQSVIVNGLIGVVFQS